MAKKAYKFPKSMGVCADQLYALRDKRIAESKKLDEMVAEESALKNHIIENLPKSEQTGASGKTANVKVVTKEIPVVENWDDFYGYVRKTKRTDLLQKRLSEGAIAEILDAGKKVPGIGTFDKVTLSLTKV